MGGSVPGRAVLLPPMLGVTETSLLSVCAIPRRVMLYYHTGRSFGVSGFPGAWYRSVS